MDTGQLMRLPAKSMQSLSKVVPAMYKAGSTAISEMERMEQMETTRNRMRSPIQDRMANIPAFMQKTETVRTKPETVARCIPLICKRGTMLAEGFDILQFDMAGSGYLHIPQMHKGRTGEPEYATGKMVMEGLLRCVQHFTLPLSYQKGSIRKSLALSFGSGVIRELAGFGIRKIRQAQERDKARMDVFGTKVTLPNGKILEYARKKIDGFKTKFTIAGPSALNIMGDYTTKASREYMYLLAKDYLQGKFAEAERNGELKPICIKIKGHSRGAVTSAEGAMMISRLLADEHSKYRRFVRFDITQFDPVPGSDTNYPMAKMVDYRTNGRDSEGRFESGGKEYAALGDLAQTTVVYSMRTQYPVFFTPQIVKGADRIIITPYDHSVGLRNIDTNRVPDGTGDSTQEGHRQAFIDNETQTAYSMGSLNSMNAGVYILGSDNRLTRVNHLEEFNHFMDEGYKGALFQRARCDAIKKSVEDWFERRGTEAQ